MRNLALVLIVLAAAACHRSGTWVDDPGNFKRAWGSSPPSNVKVVRSWYWRSAHFTREEMYYFQLSAPLAYAEAFAAENGLKPAEPDTITGFAFPNGKPSWFAPNPAARYRIWKTPESFPSGFVLVDRESGAVFIHCAQL